MSKWEITKFIQGQESDIDAGLDIVGKFIADEESKTAMGLYGKDLQAVDTALMAKSYNFDRPKKNILRNSNNTDYNIHVELGTKKMRPRPIMQTVITTNDDEIMDILGRACAK